MKFTVERDKFHDALSAVSRRAKGGPDIPILSHVLIAADGKRISLTGHDLDSCSTMDVAADVSSGGSVAVPAERLHKLTAGLPKGSTVIVEQSDNAITVRSGRSSYKFATLPAADFPPVLSFEGEAASIDLTGDQVARLFDVPSPAISQEEARFYLCGICLQPVKNGIVAVATNGHMLIKINVEVDRPDFAQVIVPERTAREIVAIAKAAGGTLRVSSTLVSIACGEQTYVSKLVAGTFPDYERVIPQPSNAPIKIDASELDASLERLMTARDPKKSAIVRIVWNSGGEITASAHSEFGHGDERIEADFERDAGEVAAQVDYLRALIDASGGETVCLDVSDPGSPIRITNPARDDFVAVCMPCRF